MIFYQHHLAAETLANVDETGFVDYATKRARTDWGHKVEPGRWEFLDFTVDDPTYADDRQTATIRVETKWQEYRLSGPGAVKMDFTLFHVVKEDGTWKLVLSPNLFTDSH